VPLITKSFYLDNEKLFDFKLEYLLNSYQYLRLLINIIIISPPQSTAEHRLLKCRHLARQIKILECVTDRSFYFITVIIEFRCLANIFICTIQL
jgi:hypothetical protein